MRPIRHLEIHAAHACNLHCDSCTHYSNQNHKGVVALEQADEWMKPWSRRVSPHTFSIVGGEPTLHPQLTEFVRLSRRHWPTSHLRLVTNGFLLHRHPELPHELGAHPDATLYLSVHHASAEYAERLRPVLELLADWTRRFGVRVFTYHSYGGWERRYHGYGPDLRPFSDGDPRRAWENCPSRHCPQIFEGAVWKCPALAYLPMQHARHGLSPEWSPYLAYRPLRPSCTDAELNEFFNREDEPACAMCPASPERIDLPNPLVPLGRRIHRDRVPPATRS